MDRGVYFFDYGNAFMKAVFDAGVTEIARNKKDTKDGFIFPSYFEDIMGPIFDYGYGPFRWVCLSGDPQDLVRTDRAAMACIDPGRRSEDRDNYNWIGTREKISWWWEPRPNSLSGCWGPGGYRPRLQQMVRSGEVGPIMIGRITMIPGGTDSSFRKPPISGTAAM